MQGGGDQRETRLFSPFIIIIMLLLFFTCCSSNRLAPSKLHTLRNPMMYTSPKFESEEAARSQVERLQNQPRLLLGHRKHCSNS